MTPSQGIQAREGAWESIWPGSSFTTCRRRASDRKPLNKTKGNRDPWILKQKWQVKGPESNNLTHNFCTSYQKIKHAIPPPKEKKRGTGVEGYIHKQLTKILKDLYSYRKKKTQPLDQQIKNCDCSTLRQSLMLPTRKELLRPLQGNPPQSPSQRWPWRTLNKGKLLSR